MTDKNLYDEAVKISFQAHRVQPNRVFSVAFLQRQLKVGYNRASELLDELVSEQVWVAVETEDGLHYILRVD